MNAKQELFCLEYMIDLNQTAAAIRAGYSQKTAGETGYELMKNPEIRARVEEMMAERSKRTGVSADRVVRELARIAFVNAPDVLDLDEAAVKTDANKDDTAAIASVRVKRTTGENNSTLEREIRLHDKTKALELLGKHMGMFEDKLRVTGEMAVQIVDDIPKAAEPKTE